MPFSAELHVVVLVAVVNIVILFHNSDILYFLALFVLFYGIW